MGTTVKVSVERSRCWGSSPRCRFLFRATDSRNFTSSCKKSNCVWSRYIYFDSPKISI